MDDLGPPDYWRSGVLRLRPRAYLKLLWLCQRADTEVSGYGCSRGGDPLTIDDFYLVAQECDPMWTSMDAEGFDDYLQDRLAEGVPPQRSGRVWVHTHPGNSPYPSGVDEATLGTVFGNKGPDGSDPWAVMAILAKGSDTYARLVVGDRECELDWLVDWSLLVEDAALIDPVAWEAEYLKLVKRGTGWGPFGCDGLDVRHVLRRHNPKDRPPLAPLAPAAPVSVRESDPFYAPTDAERAADLAAASDFWTDVPLDVWEIEEVESLAESAINLDLSRHLDALADRLWQLYELQSETGNVHWEDALDRDDD